MSPENAIPAPTSQKRIEANRKNAARSTGPRTPSGKNRSRLNGLKHGLTASIPVLPGEDPIRYQARVEAMVESFAPQNQIEVDLLERVAATTWSLERAARAEAAQLRHRIRHDAIEREQREAEEAQILGQRLFWDARGPWQLYPHHPHTGLNCERHTSWSEDPSDANNPAHLVLRLERTVAGCRLLMDRWAELKARLEPGEVWAASDQFKAVRLMGRQPVDAIDDPEVTQIFLASAKLLPDGQDATAFAPVKGEIYSSGLRDDDDDHAVYSKELKKRSLSKLRPADAEAAREVLRALVDRHVSRLKLVLARNREIAAADLAEAPDRLAFDCGPEGEKRRRYTLSAARLVNQTVKTFLSVVSCPLSVEEAAVVPGLPPIPPSEANMFAEEPLDNEQPTTDNGQSTDESSVVPDLAPILRTEANTPAEEPLDNDQPIADNGQSTEELAENSFPESRLSLRERSSFRGAKGDTHFRPADQGQATTDNEVVAILRSEPNAAESQTSDNRRPSNILPAAAGRIAPKQDRPRGEHEMTSLPLTYIERLWRKIQQEDERRENGPRATGKGKRRSKQVDSEPQSPKSRRQPTAKLT